MTARPLLVLLVGIIGCAVQYMVPADSQGAGDTDGSCSSEEIRCGDRCVDPESDANHCGECGRACSLEQACDDGTCTDECDEGRALCDQSCVEIESDPMHCGGCNRPCAAGEECEEGACHDGCSDACDDHLEVCVEDACQCRPGLSLCDGVCVDLQTDSGHCGMCGRDCGPDPCGVGQCRPDGCGDLGETCGDSCVDLSTHPLNCGECGRACDPDETCIAGDCEE